MITYFPGVPYAAEVRVADYNGIGSAVLKPGTIVAKGGYKGPESVIGNTTNKNLKGVYVLVKAKK